MNDRIKDIANSFAEEYCSDAVYPSHLFKAVLHKSIGLVHLIETDLDKDYYYLQEWADVQSGELRLWNTLDFVNPASLYSLEYTVRDGERILARGTRDLDIPPHGEMRIRIDGLPKESALPCCLDLTFRYKRATLYAAVGEEAFFDQLKVLTDTYSPSYDGFEFAGADFSDDSGSDSGSGENAETQPAPAEEEEAGI